MMDQLTELYENTEIVSLINKDGYVLKKHNWKLIKEVVSKRGRKL